MNIPEIAVSVIFPSRGRPVALRESIESLSSNAASLDDIEILVATDPDKMEDLTNFPVAVHVVPERFGYNRLHDYYNYLAERATGKWLFIWNDDVLMLTPGWDEIIARQPDAVLWPYSSQDQGGNVFPVYPKAWAECTGHIGLSPYVDLWVQEVGERLSRRVRHVPILLKHRRFDDETMSEGNGQGFPIRHGHYHSQEMTREREKDAALLRELTDNVPGNTQLISVLLPSTGMPEVIKNLLAAAENPEEIEFLITGGDNHLAIRKTLEDAEVMGQTEVHWRHHTSEIRGFSHGTWIVEGVEAIPGWDTRIRKAKEHA